MAKKIFVLGDKLLASELNTQFDFAFGGTGADGALSISSGTTTLDAGGEKVLVKNYTSISITGTAKITISNQHADGTILVLKSQGDVTITSSVTSIDLAGKGAAAGTDGVGAIIYTKAGGAGASAPSNTGTSTGGSAPTIYKVADTTIGGVYRVACGAGGGSGGNGWIDGTGGAAGAGGGALIIECAGAYNFTTGTISTAGANGSAGSTGSFAKGGSGGGGAGGDIVILYKTLTANSGTYNKSGGSGGSMSNAGGTLGGAGGAGGSSSRAQGSSGQTITNSAGANGGAGADGYSLVVANTVFI